MGSCLQRLLSLLSVSEQPVSPGFIPLVLKPRKHDVGEVVCYIEKDQIKVCKETETIRNIWNGQSRYYDQRLGAYTNFNNLTLKEFGVIKKWIMQKKTKVDEFLLNTEEWNTVYCSAIENDFHKLTKEIFNKLIMKPNDDYNEIYEWEIVEKTKEAMNEKIESKWEIMEQLHCTRNMVYVRKPKALYVLSLHVFILNTILITRDNYLI